MKHIALSIILLGIATYLSASDTVIYNQSVTLDTIYSAFDNVEVIAHHSITLDAGFTFSSNGNGAFSANADPWNIEDPEEYLPPGTIVDSLGNLDGSFVVGTIPGKAGVSPSGAATYSIPLGVPKGTKGMTPSLSINYSSQGGNGILGRGWNLGGLSSIVATGKTRYYDNEYSVITETDSACRIYWNGQRLLGINDVGLEADSFRTEVFSNTKIVRGGSSNLKYFVIKTPDGRRMVYGNMSDARIYLDDDENIQWIWLLTEVKDRNDNIITYSYTHNDTTHEAVVSEIKYGGSSASPVNSIKFHYSKREDIQYGYINDDFFLRDKILDSISMVSNSKFYGGYGFHYDTTFSETLLDHITQYDKDEYRYNATNLDWESATYNSSATPESESILSGTYYHQYTGDFTGDGISDLVSVELNSSTDNYKYHLYAGSSSGLPTSATETGDLPRSYTHEYWSQIKSLYDGEDCNGTAKSTFGIQDISYVFSGDFDGDGIEELFVKVVEWDVLAESLPDDLNSTFTYTDIFSSNNFYSNICAYESFLKNPSTDSLNAGIGRILSLDVSGTPSYAMSSFMLETSSVYENQLYQFPDLGGYGYNSIPDQDSIYYYHPDLDTMLAYCPIPDNPVHWGEFTGDGKMDYVYHTGSAWQMKKYVGGANGYSLDTNIDGDFLGMIDLNGDGINAWVGLSEEQFTSQSAFLLWYAYCPIDCDWGDQGDWNGFLATNSDIEPSYDDYCDTNCGGTDNSTCRGSFVNSGSVYSSIGYELYIKHKTGRGPEISLGLVEGAHTPQAPLLTRAIAYDVDGNNRNDLLIFNQSTLKRIYRDFKPTYSSGDITYTFTTDTVVRYLDDNVHLGDFNGDGFAELVFPDCDSSLNFITEGHPGRLVSSITNGLGIESRFNYKSLTDASVYTKESDASYPVIDFSAPWLVISSVASDNGVADSAYVEYEYEGAKIHLQGKGFMGFMKTTVDNDLLGVTQTSTMEYDTVYYYPYPDSNEQKVGGTSVSQTTYYTSVDSLGSHRFRYLVDSVEVDNFLANTESWTRFTYNDATGLLLEKQTDVDNDATITDRMSYSKAGWDLVYLPVSVSRTYYRDTICTDSTVYTYNSTTGNLTQQKAFCGTDREVTTDYADFDLYGNSKEIRTTGKKGANLSTDTDTVELRYSSDGRYLVSKDVGLNFIETYVFNASTGVLESTNGPNRKQTTFEYGPFNRKKKTILPDNLEESTTLIWATDGHKPTGALYYNWSNVSGTSASLVYYDAVGRELRTVTVGFDGDTIYSDTEYNSKGQVSRRSLPYFKTNSPIWTTYSYDKYSRDSVITNTDSTVTKYTYSNLETEVVTLDGTDTLTYNRQEVNALGEILESEDAIQNVVHYDYYPDGKLKETYLNEHSSQKILLVYDAQGNRTSITDPDAGPSTSLYDAFGQLLYQVNANDDTTTFVYDNVGRTIKTTDERGDMFYSYITDTTTAAFGQIDTIYNSNYSLYEVYTYDSDFGRLQTETRLGAGKTYTNSYTYDWFGRLLTREYPSEFEVEYTYNSLGHLDQVKGNGMTLWNCSDVNAMGQITSYSQGSHNTAVGYDMHGVLESVTTGTMVDWDYGFDKFGNLTSRFDDVTNQKEEFTYDVLNRLIGIKYYNNGTYYSSEDVTIGYDNCGNITSKTGISSSINYGDDGKRPHAIKSIQNPDASYDPPPQDITYTCFNKVATISDTITGGSVLDLEIAYGLGNQRIKTVLSRNDTIQQVKYFSGDYEEDSTSAGHYKHHYISGGNGLTAIFVQDGSGNDTMYYILSDHLGSLTTIVNASTGATDNYSFDAWGIPRSASDWRNPASEGLFAGRGFTGHEHLADFNLINMNGRVYDPGVGRFLSPDPFVQSPTYPNNYNRYTYVLNNPLKYTDPSGYLTYLSNPGSFEYASTHIDQYDNSANQWAESWNQIPTYGGGGYSTYDHGSFGGGTFTAAQALEQNNPLIFRSRYFDKELGKWIEYDDVTRRYYYNGSAPYWGTGLVQVKADMGEYVRWVRDFGVQWTRIYMDPSSSASSPWFISTLGFANGTVAGLGLMTAGREVLEWEYLRQARLNRIKTGNYSQSIKHSLRDIRRVGQGTTVLNGAISIAKFTTSDRSWGDYGQLGIGLASTGLTYTPEPITTGIGLSIGLIDALGGFNPLYRELDYQNNLYKATGGIILPIMGIPQIIFLKK